MGNTGPFPADLPYRRDIGNWPVRGPSSETARLPAPVLGSSLTGALTGWPDENRRGAEKLMD